MIKNLKSYVCLAALFSCFGAFANTTTTTAPAEEVTAPATAPGTEVEAKKEVKH